MNGCYGQKRWAKVIGGATGIWLATIGEMARHEGLGRIANSKVDAAFGDWNLTQRSRTVRKPANAKWG